MGRGFALGPLSEQIAEFVLALGVSDFCDNRPTFSKLLVTQAWHIGIGAILGLLARAWPPLAAIGFAVLLAKELAFDIPGCDMDVVVMLDSLCDLGSTFSGFGLCNRWRQMNSGCVDIDRHQSQQASRSPILAPQWPHGAALPCSGLWNGVSAK
jgi:hypothetical protein